MKRPRKRKMITNQPHKQNIRKINRRQKGQLVKPYGLNGRTSVVLP